MFASAPMVLVFDCFGVLTGASCWYSMERTGVQVWPQPTAQPPGGCRDGRVRVHSLGRHAAQTPRSSARSPPAGHRPKRAHWPGRLLASQSALLPVSPFALTWHAVLTGGPLPASSWLSHLMFRASTAAALRTCVEEHDGRWCATTLYNQLETTEKARASYRLGTAMSGIAGELVLSAHVLTHRQTLFGSIAGHRGDLVGVRRQVSPPTSPPKDSRLAPTIRPEPGMASNFVDRDRGLWQPVHTCEKPGTGQSIAWRPQWCRSNSSPMTRPSTTNLRPPARLSRPGLR